MGPQKDMNNLIFNCFRAELKLHQPYHTDCFSQFSCVSLPNYNTYQKVCLIL